MGLLINGEWRDEWYDTAATGGRFVRKDAAFRNWITSDGTPGPSGTDGFAAQAGRYHLYVSLACPWAHRTLIMRSLKGLQNMVSVSVVHWRMRQDGWTFADGAGVLPDTVNGARFLRDVYTASDPVYTGRVTVPVLWDKQRHAIVSNEPSEILRMLGSAFDNVGAVQGDYYPASLRTEIDAINARLYDTLNNGVYKAGFATTQDAYQQNAVKVFETLDMLEDRLKDRRFLFGAEQTEADWRLFTTMVRFDPVYVGHFKCNIRRIHDYPHLTDYLRDLYQTPGVPETVDMRHIKEHYYRSHRTINPTGIVPVGPELDLTMAHGREALS